MNIPRSSTGSRVIQGSFRGRPFLQPGRVTQRRPATAIPPQVLRHAFQAEGAVNLQAHSAGQPLHPAVLQKMEAAFGTSFSDVRIHVGPQASSIGAEAFTIGADLYFAPGKYDPHTAAGNRVLAHELSHVVQQRNRRVRNPFGYGTAIVQDPALEAEADRTAARVSALACAARPVQPRMQTPTGAPRPAAHVQAAIQMKQAGAPRPQPAVGRTVGRDPIQRLKIVSDTLVSTFDTAKIINTQQAVITVRSSDTFTGGHATIYLEYLDGKFEGVMDRIDLFVNEDNEILIRREEYEHEYKPSNVFTKMLYSRSITSHKEAKADGKVQSYVMSHSKVQAVIAKADAVKAQAKRGLYAYSQQANTLWNLNLLSKTTYINCADFAAMMLYAAGIQSASSGLLNMPSTVATKDTRTKEQVYKDTVINIL
jgi:hypothetical protein